MILTIKIFLELYLTANVADRKEKVNDFNKVSIARHIVGNLLYSMDLSCGCNFLFYRLIVGTSEA